MARFDILSNTDWDSYNDIAGGTVTTAMVNLFSYVSANGYTVTLHGNHMTYDAAGIAVGGTVTRLDIYRTDAGKLVHYAEYTGLAVALVDFERLALGLTSGSASVTDTDIEALYAIMRAGDDLYIGSNQGRTALGYDGNDTLYGNGGDDWMVGGAGIDSYFGGEGRNGVSFLDGTATEGVSIDFTKTTGNILNDGHGNVETATGFDMAEGTNFADRFISNPQAGIFYGHGGDDTMTGGYYSDTFDGGAGVDVFYGGRSNDAISFEDVFGAGHGVVVDFSAQTGPQILNDGFGNAETAMGMEDVLGSVRADNLTGGAGLNRFWGYGSDDTLEGGAGNDSLYGGDGDDRVYGGTGDDALYDSLGNGRLYGGAGDDAVEGDKGKDTMDGGAGTDVLGFWDIDKTGHGARVDLNRLHGNILDDGYGNIETATGFENLDGSDKKDTFTGNTKTNLLWGERGDDRLNGGGGADGLYGGYDSDKLYGGLGNDTVMGGFGSDTVTGGDGADIFVFHETFGITEFDHAVDYQAGVDRIILNSAGTVIGSATLLPAGFLSGAGISAARTASQIVIYDTTSGRLYFDQDGSGPENGYLVAVFDNHAKLTYDMFSFEVL